jgi:hypothetical protein
MPIAFRIMPDHQFLREAVDYDQQVLRWRWRPLTHFKNERAQMAWNPKMAGKPVGVIGRNGHRMFRLAGQTWLASRIIWKWMTGEDPDCEIDHIDTDPTNDCWTNLRKATSSQQKQNKGAQSNNRLGLKGVTKHRRLYRARISIDGVKHELGRFDTPEAAHAAYVAASRRLHGAFARAE